MSTELRSGSHFRAVPPVQLGSEAGRRKMVHSSCFLSHARHVSGHLGGCKKAQGSMILTEGREEGIENQFSCVWWVLEAVGSCHVADEMVWGYLPPIMTVGKDRFQRVFGWLEGCLLDIQVDVAY